MHAVLNWFNSTAFHAFGVGTTWAEVFGFVTGLASVYYCAVVSSLNFPVSILNAIFFFILFQDAKLFADSWLQVYYVIICAIGWVAWLRAGPNKTELPVTRASWQTLAVVAVSIAAFTVLFIPVLKSHQDPYPFLDSLTTGLSLGAQFLLSFKKIENWALWITADLIYIPLYGAKHLWLTSIVYVFFLALCLYAIRPWLARLRQARVQKVTDATAVARI